MKDFIITVLFVFFDVAFSKESNWSELNQMSGKALRHQQIHQARTSEEIFLVYLSTTSKKDLCHGFIITYFHFTTVAECVYEYVEVVEQLRARIVGEQIWNIEQRHIAHILPHDKYNYESAYESDIAIVTFKGTVPSELPIPTNFEHLSGDDVQSNLRVNLLVWKPNLQDLKVESIPFDIGRIDSDKNLFFSKNPITFYMNYKGAPVFFGNKIVGIGTSTIVENRRAFIQISSFLEDFIIAKTRGPIECEAPLQRIDSGSSNDNPNYEEDTSLTTPLINTKGKEKASSSRKSKFGIFK